MVSGRSGPRGPDPCYLHLWENIRIQIQIPPSLVKFIRRGLSLGSTTFTNASDGDTGDSLLYCCSQTLELPPTGDLTTLTGTLVLLVFTISQSGICLFLLSICILIVLALVLPFKDASCLFTLIVLNLKYCLLIM